MMISASLDWAAMTIAAALTVEEESVPHNGGAGFGAAMRRSVDVTFDPAHGYVGTAPELRWRGVEYPASPIDTT